MSDSFIEYAITQNVPVATVTLILMIPIVVTVIAFFRQVIGIKAFGIYTPALVTFAFWWIGAEADGFLKGLAYGVTIFIGVIAVGTVTRLFLRKFRLLYLPRMAIVLTVVALITLVFLILVGKYNRTGLAGVSIVPILIMITLVEKFVSTQIEKGSRQAIVLSLETLLISIVCYIIISWNQLLIFILEYPWIVLLTIPINIFLGRWTGLRLSEYIRFKDVIKNVQSPTKKQ